MIVDLPDPVGPPTGTPRTRRARRSRWTPCPGRGRSRGVRGGAGTSAVPLTLQGGRSCLVRLGQDRVVVVIRRRPGREGHEVGGDLDRVGRGGDGRAATRSPRSAGSWVTRGHAGSTASPGRTSVRGCTVSVTATRTQASAADRNTPDSISSIPPRTSTSRRGTGAGTSSTVTAPEASRSTTVTDFCWFRSPKENASGDPAYRIRSPARPVAGRAGARARRSRHRRTRTRRPGRRRRPGCPVRCRSVSVPPTNACATTTLRVPGRSARSARTRSIAAPTTAWCDRGRGSSGTAREGAYRVRSGCRYGMP